MWDMGVGWTEMLLIAVIALIVFGPEKFPEYAKIFFRAIKDLQGYIEEVKSDLAKEVVPLKSEFDKLNRQDPEKLLDALMKTGGSSEDKKEEISAKTDDTPAVAAEPASDTPHTDADNNPYQPSSEAVSEEPAHETPSTGPTITGDGAQYAQKDEFFNVKSPERMD